MASASGQEKLSQRHGVSANTCWNVNLVDRLSTKHSLISVRIHKKVRFWWNCGTGSLKEFLQIQALHRCGAFCLVSVTKATGKKQSFLTRGCAHDFSMHKFCGDGEASWLSATLCASKSEMKGFVDYYWNTCEDYLGVTVYGRDRYGALSINALCSHRLTKNEVLRARTLVIWGNVWSHGLYFHIFHTHVKLILVVIW